MQLYFLSSAKKPTSDKRGLNRDTFKSYSRKICQVCPGIPRRGGGFADVVDWQDVLLLMNFIVHKLERHHQPQVKMYSLVKHHLSRGPPSLRSEVTSLYKFMLLIQEAVRAQSSYWFWYCPEK